MLETTSFKRSILRAVLRQVSRQDSTSRAAADSIPYTAASAIGGIHSFLFIAVAISNGQTHGTPAIQRRRHDSEFKAR